jgi:hypothetical protein
MEWSGWFGALLSPDWPSTCLSCVGLVDINVRTTASGIRTPHVFYRLMCICTLVGRGSHALHRHSCACPVTIAPRARCHCQSLLVGDAPGWSLPSSRSAARKLRAPPRYNRPRRGHFRLYHATDRRMAGGVKPLYTQLTKTRSLSRPCAPLLHASDRGPRLLPDHHVDRAHDDV